MKKVRLGLVVCLIIGLLTIFSFSNDGNAASKSMQLTANIAYNAEMFMTQYLEKFVDKVKEKTNDTINIVPVIGGALGYKGPELLKVVKDGLVPISEMLVTGIAGDEPIFGIYSMPFMISNWDEARIFNKITRPYFDNIAEKKWNQKILYVAPWPFVALWTKKEVRSIEDMKNLKVRTYDKNGALAVKAAGGNPFALPHSEIYTSLATNLIDAVITSSPTAVNLKFWEVLKYHQPINLNLTASMVNINLDYFKQLNEEQQQALLEAGEEIEEEIWLKIEEIDGEKLKIVREHGMVTIPVSAEFSHQLNEATSIIRSNYFAERPESKKIYDEYMEAVGK